MNKATAKGFTIVELLIVIVVIAILAAITVVAFNGIQDRAYAAKAGSAVDSALKVLELYKVDNGGYPITGGEYVCIGQQASDYPAESGFTAGSCGPEMNTSSTLNSALSEYTKQPLSGTLPVVTISGASYRGIFYYSSGGEYAELSYALKEGQSCTRAAAVIMDGAAGCTVEIGGRPEDK